jgi:hypothetical protein
MTSYELHHHRSITSRVNHFDARVGNLLLEPWLDFYCEARNSLLDRGARMLVRCLRDFLLVS